MQPQLGIRKRFIRSLSGVDRCSLSWWSRRGLLEVYEELVKLTLPFLQWCSTYSVNKCCSDSTCPMYSYRHFLMDKLHSMLPGWTPLTNDGPSWSHLWFILSFNRPGHNYICCSWRGQMTDVEIASGWHISLLGEEVTTARALLVYTDYHLRHCLHHYCRLLPLPAALAAASTISYYYGNAGTE